MHHQPGVTQEPGPASRFVVFSVKDETAIGTGLGRISELVSEVKRLAPDLPLTGTVSLSAGLLGRLGQPVPPELGPFTTLVNGPRTMPGTQADLLLHVNGGRPDLCFEVAHRFRSALGTAVAVTEEVAGFRYLDDRDMTGFIDGTENPKGDERQEAALIGAEDSEFAQGSYVIAQRYEHQLARFTALAQTDQERVIGRTKPDSIELEDKPPDAHISRVVIEEDGEELEIVRHSMPYGGADVAGLFFLAYCKHQTTFEKMLARMMGTAADGQHDRLMDYTTPKSGHFFFAPSVEHLRRL